MRNTYFIGKSALFALIFVNNLYFREIRRINFHGIVSQMRISSKFLQHIFNLLLMLVSSEN